MAKINARELDPQRYSCIQTEQQELSGSNRHLPENPLFSRVFGFLFCSGYMKGTRRVHEKFMRKPPSGLQLPRVLSGTGGNKSPKLSLRSHARGVR